MNEELKKEIQKECTKLKDGYWYFFPKRKTYFAIKLRLIADFLDEMNGEINSRLLTHNDNN